MEPRMFKPSSQVPDPWGIRVIWKCNRRGTTIGSYDGIVGVLLDTGEYVDVPMNALLVCTETNCYHKGGG